MALKTNTAEGGSDGTTVTTGNSGGASGDAFSSVSAGAGGVVAYSSTNRFKGLLSILMQQATAATSNTMELSDTANASDSFAVRFYLSLNALPSATIQGPLSIRSAANASLGRLEVSSTGQVRLVLGSSTSTFTVTTLATATWYRFEVYGSGLGSGSAATQCDVYAGDATGSTFLTTSLAGIATTAATTGIMRYGRIGGTGSNDWYVDDIAQNIGTATPLGPSAAPPPTWSWAYSLTQG